MPTRTIKPYKRKSVSVRGRVKVYSVKGYKQKYKKDRGPEPKEKKASSLRAQKRTAWLMNEKGEFTGRSGRDGKTTSKKHVMSGKDYTGVLVDKYGRIYGRYKSSPGKERYDKEIKKAHPKK